MKMEVIAVQTQYGVLGSNKVKDWTSTLTPPPPPATSLKKSATEATTTTTKTTTTEPYMQKNTTNKIKNSINKKSNRTAEVNSSSNTGSNKSRAAVAAAAIATNNHQQQPSYNHKHHTHTPSLPPSSITAPASAPPTVLENNLFYCDDIDGAAVNELSLRLLDELRAAKSRHLTCTEVSLPCDLTPRIAAEIIRVSEKEPCGIRGCTIYIEFEDEPNNSRRIASLKLDPETVSTFEVYLTLRQDHRGWTALLPQFMKSLARTITISPEFTIIKHKLYSPQQNSSYSYGGLNYNGNSTSAAISTPTS